MEKELSQFFVLLYLALMVAFLSNASHEEQARKTMDEFSGYPSDSHAPHYSISPLSLSVDLQNLLNQIEDLSTFSDVPAPAVSRILYTPKDVLARRYIKSLMEQAGLSVRVDTVGNIFGRWVGTEAALSAVATGSHIDAIPYSGKYDGVIGVLGAIEAINVLKRSGFQPKRSLEVIMFTSEEPTRFGIGCLGSRLLSGNKELDNTLKQLVDEKNISFLEAAKSAGFEIPHEDLSRLFLKKDSYFSFVELHIEQGPILEEEGISIGAVTAIAAPASLSVDFEGNGGHAGTVLMPDRNDAGLAAAELAIAVEKHVLESDSIDTVGTVGVIELHPGAINSIPSKAHIEIDARDINEDRRDIVVHKIHQSAIKIAENRGVKLSNFRIINQDPPALSSNLIISTIEEAAKQLNLSFKLMISRAYHDSLFMARISPMGMIFIPCYKGYSHKPEEFVSDQDIANGVQVLALSLAKLSIYN